MDFVNSPKLCSISMVAAFALLLAPSFALASEPSSNESRVHSTVVYKSSTPVRTRTETSIKTQLVNRVSMQPGKTRRIVEPIPDKSVPDVSPASGFRLQINDLSYTDTSNMPVHSPRAEAVRTTMPVLLDRRAYFAR